LPGVEVAVGELTSTGNDVTEVGWHSSSSPLSPYAALERSRLPFLAGCAGRFLNIPHPICPESGTFSDSGECSNHSATVPTNYPVLFLPKSVEKSKE